ncbi:MAG: carbohydrate ABC transporter permease, partial [Oscillospiraceae bacterium]
MTKTKSVQSNSSAVGRVLGKASQYLVELMVLILSLYPILWIFISSFKTRMDILNHPLSLPSVINLSGYKTVLFDTPIVKYFCNSVLVATSSTFFNVIILAMAAYVVARYDFKLKKLVVTLFASTLFIPGIAISYPIYLMINRMGLYDTKTGLSFTYVGLALAMSFFILRSYMLTIPKEINEAAPGDGAGPTTTFIKIVRPLAWPGVATAAIITFLGNWNDFYYALLLTGGDNARTIPVTIFNFTSQFRSNLAALFAALII